ncbi:hypothetical protein FOPE_04908 [Fonsecaea pedrosoi]|nr:hypothetical protein FOPE_04908 [Fonsecaea pedrosoi]
MPSAASSGAQHFTPSAQDWRKHQPIIYNLYIYQRFPLKEMREYLQQEYSFDASIPQYKRKLKEWRYSKNLKASTCKALGDSLERRGLSGSNVVTSVSGVTLSPKKLQRALRRHYIPTLQRKFGLEEKTTTPEGISIRRSLVDSLSLSNIRLPAFSWLQQAQESAAALHGATPVLSSHTQLPQSHLPETNKVSNELLTVDVQSILLGDFRPKAIARTQREAAASRILNRLPRVEPDSVGQNFNAVIHQAGSINLYSLTSFVIYLCANNHLDDAQFDHFMVHISPQGSLDVLKHLAHSKSACAWKFEERLLVYAARTDRYDLVDLLKNQWALGSISTPRTKWLLERMLFTAIEKGHETFVLTLLEEKIGNNKGRVIDVITSISQELLKQAAQFLPGAFRFILNSMSTIGKAQVLPLAVKAGLSIEGVSLLIHKGADVDATDDEGCTALCYSARSGNFGLTQLLLRNGACPEGGGSDSLDQSPKSQCIPPLFFAAESGHTDICELLLQAGADVESSWHRPHKDSHRHQRTLAALRGFRNAVEVAIRDDHISVLECLITHGAFVSSRGRGYAPLHLAADSGSFYSVGLLIRCGADIHEYCTSGITRTALQAACFARNKQCASFLIGAGARINDPAMGFEGKTALQHAAWRGDEGLVKYLLELGADVNAPCAPDHGVSALQAAVYSRNETLVGILLAWGADVNGNISRKNGQSAIVAAVEAGSESVFRTLVKAGADLSPVKRDNRTYCCPFIKAAQENSEDFVRRLLDLDIDIDARLDSGYSIAEEAIRSSGAESWRVVETILEHSPAIRLSRCQGRTLFIDMWDGIDLSFLRVLVHRGFDINKDFVGDHFGKRRHGGMFHPKRMTSAIYRSFLQKACAKGNLGTVEYLLSAGADPNSLPSVYFDPVAFAASGTALQLATMGRHTHLIKTLLCHGADINAPPAEFFGRTALQAASQAGDLKVVEMLLDNGANANTPASKWAGVTALQGAAIEGYVRIVQTLLAAGADVGAPGAREDGRTAVNGAAEWGRLDMVKLLLDHHPLQDGESLSGICEQAAEYARTGPHWAVVELLETYERMPGSP